jgi:NitT/TauT family transport system permease protein
VGKIARALLPTRIRSALRFCPPYGASVWAATRAAPTWPTSAVLQSIGLPVATGIAFLAVWEWAVTALHVPQVVLPSPSLIAHAIIGNTGLLATHLIPTTLVAVVGFILAAIAGTAIAIAITASRLLRDTIYPCVLAFQLVPKIALAPIFIVWFGMGLESRFAFSAFISFFPIVVAMASGLEATDRRSLVLSRALNATPWRVLLHVRIPYALPFLLAGMKVAITMAVIGTVVGEFISSRSGLGFLILDAASRMQTDLIMAAIVVLCAVGLALYGVIEAADRIVHKRFGG